MRILFYSLLLLYNCTNRSYKKPSFESFLFITTLPNIGANNTISNYVDTLFMYKGTQKMMFKQYKIIFENVNGFDKPIRKEGVFLYCNRGSKLGLAKYVNKFETIKMDSVEKSIIYFQKIPCIDSFDILIDSNKIENFFVKKYTNLLTDISYPDTTYLYYSSIIKSDSFCLNKEYDIVSKRKLVKIVHLYKKERYRDSKPDKDIILGFEIVPSSKKVLNEFLKVEEIFQNQLNKKY